MIDVRNENVEIELKILIYDEEIFKTYLKEHTSFEKEEKLEDIYFENPDYPFLFINEKGLKDAKKWLRVRKSDKGDTITFKKRVENEIGEILYHEEVETKISSASQMKRILESLGFVESCQYKKTRKCYHDNDFEFDVDFVDALGMVVEIEYQGKIEHLEDGKNKIREFLKKIGIEHYTELKTGYPQILWNGIDFYL